MSVLERADPEQLRRRILAARDTDPQLARRLVDQLVDIVRTDFAAADLRRRRRVTAPAATPTPKRRARQRKPRPTMCPDCHGPAGDYRNGRCHTCYVARRRGRVRTPADRGDRVCMDCQRGLQPGQSRRGRCGTCTKYFRQHGHTRPSCPDCHGRVGKYPQGRCATCYWTADPTAAAA